VQLIPSIKQRLKESYIMATVTDTDLQELKDLITSGFNRIDINQARLEEKFVAMDQRLELIESRVNSFENRVNSFTGWFIGSLIALVGGLLAILGKIAFFPNP
jgi:hypothetical protein